MKKIVACNWKQDYNHSQITRLSHTPKPNCDLSVAVPFVYLQSTRNLLPNYIKLGAQTCSKYENGPYTGEVSCSMLEQISCDYVIIGHSERRMHFNENDDDIQAKIKLATKNNLQVILCVGENLEQRENGMEFDVVKEQLKVVESYSNIIVAYEPIWAIGTGKVPSNDNIEDMIAYIKKEKPEKIVSKVIYGGSVSAKNINQLNEIKSCDGYLIGGASLTDDIFYIIKQCSKE